jgi:dienelactone hydrolase
MAAFACASLLALLALVTLVIKSVVQWRHEREMKAAGANFRIVVYPGVKHSFTNPKAETHGMPQLGYNKDADMKSWQEMLTLFKQVFN